MQRELEMGRDNVARQFYYAHNRNVYGTHPAAVPVIGYATWHGYRDTIEAEAWPEHAKLPETD